MPFFDPHVCSPPNISELAVPIEKSWTCVHCWRRWVLEHFRSEVGDYLGSLLDLGGVSHSVHSARGPTSEVPVFKLGDVGADDELLFPELEPLRAAGEAPGLSRDLAILEYEGNEAVRANGTPQHGK